MLVDTNDLIKVSTYAKQKNVSRTWVDKLIQDGTLKAIFIDSVKFIKEDSK